MRQYGRVPEAGRPDALLPVPSRRRRRRQRARRPHPGAAVGHPLHRPGDQPAARRGRPRRREPGRGPACAPAASCGRSSAPSPPRTTRGWPRAPAGRVARVKCATPGKGARALPPGVVELLVVPAAFDALRVGDLSELYLDPDLARPGGDPPGPVPAAHHHPAHPRAALLGHQGLRRDRAHATTSRPKSVQARVAEALKAFLSPLAIARPGQASGDAMGPDWEGWPFGRDLFISEVYTLIQKVPGVKHVLDVRALAAAGDARPRGARAPDDEREEQAAEAAAGPGRRTAGAGARRYPAVFAGARDQDRQRMRDVPQASCGSPTSRSQPGAIRASR